MSTRYAKPVNSAKGSRDRDRFAIVAAGAIHVASNVFYYAHFIDIIIFRKKPPSYKKEVTKTILPSDNLQS